MAKTTKKSTGHAAKAEQMIAKLIKRLIGLKKKSDSEGRAIRRQLRKLGHRGGTRTTKPKPAKKVSRAAINKAAQLRDAGYTSAQALAKVKKLGL